jgi:hypothetical protein
MKWPALASSKAMRWPVLLRKKISTSPDTMMYIASPGSPAVKSAVPAENRTSSRRSASADRSCSSSNAKSGTSARSSERVGILLPAAAH